jgi:hypothetical protein
MSSADGTVIGLPKIADAGEPASCWNMIIVSDGYTPAQMGQFASDANAVRDRLLREPPFIRPEISGVINIYRLDVSSVQQGADKPRCADGAGTGQRVATYFDSTFCSDGRTERLLYGNASLVVQTVAAQLPQWHQIIVLVNDPERGGAGGNVAWFSNGGADWREVAIHELGHSAFGLADEYDYGGPDHWTASEPGEPNVTAMADPGLVKWRAFVNAPPGSPTRRNPSCAASDPGPSGFPAATVGTFEGAKYSHCGAFRPSWNCMMRMTSAPFCTVCVDRIVRVMARFAATDGPP